MDDIMNRTGNISSVSNVNGQAIPTLKYYCAKYDKNGELINVVRH